MEIQLHAFLTSALVVNGEIHFPAALPTGERIPTG